MKRSVGLTILAILLFLQSIACFANLVGGVQPKTAITQILTALYGTSALITATGLWKIKPWAYKAFLILAAVVVGTLLDFQFGRFGMYKAPIPAFILFALFVFTLLWLMTKYFKKKTLKV